jgi:hypothetical protein
MTTKIPERYIPSSISRKDKEKQRKNILKSRKMYKTHKYFQRPKIHSFTSKKSSYVNKAMKKYNLQSMKPNQEMAKKTSCSLIGLKKIVNKGEGAYYSSGSRPNQTPQSWGYARLASVLVGGPASKIDFHITKKYCNRSFFNTRKKKYHKQFLFKI